MDDALTLGDALGFGAIVGGVGLLIAVLLVILAVYARGFNQ